MTRVAGRVPVLLVVVTAVAVLAIAYAPPDSRASVTRLALLAIGIVAGWRIVRRSAALTRSTPERFEAELAEPLAGTSDLAGMRVIDTTLRLATASAFGVEFRLKPLLRELVAWRLMRNRGIDVETMPEAARRTIGEPLWELTQAADERPDNGAPGLPLPQLQASLDQLERI